MVRLLWKFLQKRDLNMIIEKQSFIKMLNECVNIMGSNNHHLAFFHDCVSIEIIIMREDQLVGTDLRVKRVPHPLPLRKIDRYFLPIYTDANDPVYKTEDELFFAWRRRYGEPGKHFRMRREYYAQKNSWVARKIFSLSDDFTQKMVEIADTTGLSLSSLHDMYVLMTGINDFRQSDHKSRFQGYLSYPVPESVSEDQRDPLLVYAWNNIFLLLLEAYWVIALVVMIDVLNILGLYEAEGLVAARDYLFQTTVYSELEKQAIAIETRQDLGNFLKKEFPFVEDLLTSFQLFASGTARKYAARKKHMEDWTLNPLRSDDNALDKPKHDSYWDEQSFHDLLGKEIQHGEHFDEDQSIQEDTQEDYTDNHRTKRQRPKKDIFLHEVTVLLSLERRMEIQGLLKTYRLVGDPEKVINYVMKTVYNETRTILQNNYNYKIDEMYGITQKTFKRWKKEIDQGKHVIAIRPERPSGVKSISDLFPAEVEIIKKVKENKQLHREKGSFTQNELIQILQNETFLKSLLREGIGIKKYSRTALRNRLGKLIKANKIPCRKKGISYLFNEADVPLILKELSNLP